jgi:hypothetical protein
MPSAKDFRAFRKALATFEKAFTTFQGLESDFPLGIMPTPLQRRDDGLDQLQAIVAAATPARATRPAHVPGHSHRTSRMVIAYQQ